jgi:hypothetical protein
MAHRTRTKVVRKCSDPIRARRRSAPTSWLQDDLGQFRVPSGVWNVLMTAGPNTNSTECNREKLVNALPGDALIKELEAPIYSNEIWQRALDVVRKRIASREVRDNMLLHVVVSLSKSIAVLSCTAERRRS